MFQQQEGEEQPPGMQGYAVTADAYPAYPYPQARDQYLAIVPDDAMTQLHRPRPVHCPVQNLTISMVEIKTTFVNVLRYK